MARTPTNPISAHHRLLRNLVSTSLKGYSPTPDELDRISRIFQKMGGSWEKVFLGSTDGISLLRRIIRVAADEGFISKSPRWG